MMPVRDVSRNRQKSEESQMSPLINRRNLFKLGLTSGLAGAMSAWWPLRAFAQRHVPFRSAITPSGDGLWALDLLGRVFTYGGAPKFGTPPEPVRELYVALVAAPSGNGLYALTADGSVRTFGDARAFDDRAGGGRRIPFVDLAITPSGDGLWALDLLGRVFSYGGAPKFAMPPEPIRERYVALVAAPSGNGLYALTADGSVRTHGDVPAFDDRGAAGRQLVPFVDLAITASGDGLWALDLFGRVFSYGGAPKSAPRLTSAANSMWHSRRRRRVTASTRSPRTAASGHSAT